MIVLSVGKLANYSKRGKCNAILLISQCCSFRKEDRFVLANTEQLVIVWIRLCCRGKNLRESQRKQTFAFAQEVEWTFSIAVRYINKTKVRIGGRFCRLSFQRSSVYKLSGQTKEYDYMVVALVDN